MKKTISSNQAGLIFCIFAISLKLSALPSLMFTYSGNDSYITCLIALIFDFIGTIVIIGVMHKFPDKTLGDLIKETLGKVIEKIIQAILFVYFMSKCVLILQELHDYFIATLFEELNPIYFLIVLGLLIIYATTKNFRSIGRVIELIFWPTFIGILFTLVFPIEDIQIEKLLPVFEQGFVPIFRGLSRTTFAFGDYMILLPLLGNTVVNKKSKKKIILYVLGAFNFIFSFYIIFVGSFGKFSMSQTLALGELPLHNTTPATIGKLEWLTIIIWTVILLTSSLILAIASRHIFDNLFNISDNNWSHFVVSIIIVLVVALTYMQLETIIHFAVTPIFAGLAGGIQILFVTTVSISAIILKKRQTPQAPTPPNTISLEKKKC